MRIADVIARRKRALKAIKPDLPLCDAIGALELEPSRALVVSADGRTILGVLADHDVVAALRRYDFHARHSPVSTVMHRDYATCAPSDRVCDVFAKMRASGVDLCVVIEDGQPIDILTECRLTICRLAELEAETAQLRRYLAA